MATVSDRDSAGTRIAAATPEASRIGTGNAQPLPLSQEQNLRQLSAVGPGDDDNSERSATPSPVNPAISAGDSVVAPSAAGGSIRSSNPAAVDSGEQGKKPAPEKKIPSNNILHNYVSYTYQLSWHLMTITDYNNLVKNPNSRYVPKNVLVASAGKYNSEFVRSAAWKEDFYFESLEMQTVIGLNARTRGTNAIDITFKLIEPYGVTLLERLLKAADSVVGDETDITSVTASNYTQLPYMLQIDFLGYNDEGVPSLIPGATKYIPINVLSIEFSVTNRGAEYTIRAVPFNHQAFKSSRASIPANFEITPGTVGEFFKGKDSSFVLPDFVEQRNTLVENYEQAFNLYRDAQIGARDEGIDFGRNQDIYLDPLRKAERSLTTYSVRGIEAALNNYYQFEKVRKPNPSINIAPIYEFRIDPEIAGARIDTVNIAPKDTTLGSGTSTQADYQNSQKTRRGQPPPGIPVDPTTKIYRINAGTSIIELINIVIRNSTYIINQIDKDNNSPTQTERGRQELRQENTDPINWFKIIPSVEILGYDTRLNSYALKMIYKVIKHPIKGRNLTRISQAPVQDKDVSKIYNYIYSGQNQDIIDINIEFNTQYFLAITSGPEKFNFDNSLGAGNSQNTAPEQVTRDSAFPVTIQPNSTNQQQSYARYNDPKAIAAADVAANLMNRSADMVTVTLKIIGDPSWIKQDDIFGNGRQQLLAQEATGASSIRTDPAEVYIRLNFDSADDIDDVSGKYKIRPEYSLFSGFYRVISVLNRFEGGKFTQDLELVRILNQDPNRNKIPPRQAPPGSQLVNPVSLPTTSANTRRNFKITEELLARANRNPRVLTVTPTDIDNQPDNINPLGEFLTRDITETTISPLPIPQPASASNPELIRLQQELVDARNRIQTIRLQILNSSDVLDTASLRGVLNQAIRDLERIQERYRQVQSEVNYGK